MITEARRELMTEAGRHFINECMKHDFTHEEICVTLSCLLKSYFKTLHIMGMDGDSCSES